MLSENLARVRARIQQTCQRCGRNATAVTLVCVTKEIAIEAIQEAISLGVADLGENRVQEAKLKHAAFAAGETRWHLIGHLQRNKAKDAVELFSVIHSVDSAALAEELERQMEKRTEDPRPQTRGRAPLEVFVQVNVSGEATKFGCTPAEAPSLAQAIGRLPHLRLVGLMAMAPFVENPEQARPYFRHLRLLRDGIVNTCHLSPVTCHLSMGMSNDFEVAIEEGADFVRIGSAIFQDQRPETRD